MSYEGLTYLELLNVAEEKGVNINKTGEKKGEILDVDALRTKLERADKRAEAADEEEAKLETTEPDADPASTE